MDISNLERRHASAKAKAEKLRERRDRLEERFHGVDIEHRVAEANFKALDGMMASIRERHGDRHEERHAEHREPVLSGRNGF